MTTPTVVFNTKQGPSTIKRAIFGPGMLLQSEDLEQLNNYTRNLSRLLFRSFFGCGVVCGLTVDAEDKCGKTSVTVGAGVALNCQGDPIYVPNPVTFDATEGCDATPKTLYVWLCSCPKCCAPRTPSCGCDDCGGTPACTREVDWYEIHVGVGDAWPKCACGCEPPPSPSGPGTCASEPDQSAAAGAGEPAAKSHRETETSEDPCRCADPNACCYKPHYLGVCGCKCEDSNCVVLALLTHGENNKWTTDYKVRRFIRPVLMRDPLVYPLPPGCEGEQGNPPPAFEMLLKKAAKTKPRHHSK